MIRAALSRATDFSKARPWIMLLLTLTVILTLAWVALASMVVFSGSDSSDAIAGTESYSGTALDEPAPDFELVNQHGERVALSDFQGQVVVLAFLDPLCEDVCPLTALHFRQTYEELGAEAEGAVFLAVNVNAGVNDVADVASASEKWGIHELPTWHFLTGGEETLREVWHAYGAEALPDDDGTVTHTPGVFVIDPAGIKRWYIYTPLTDDLEWDGPRLGEILPKQIRQLLEEFATS